MKQEELEEEVKVAKKKQVQTLMPHMMDLNKKLVKSHLTESWQ